MQKVDDDPYNNLLKNSDIISNNYDILLKFHEVGMFSGKFPSNSKVELYNYEYNGVVIKNQLTSTNILYSELSKLQLQKPSEHLELKENNIVLPNIN